MDEIQRLPQLLNEVQLLLQKHKKLRFILTGSSARKLRDGSTNLGDVPESVRIRSGHPVDLS
ncbi:MAG: ATP-binding protein, partial [Bradymonadales bacterium]